MSAGPALPELLVARLAAALARVLVADLQRSLADDEPVVESRRG